MIKFKEFIKEYRKAPLAQSLDKVELRNYLADEDNLVQIKTHTGIPNLKAITIFEYSFDKKNKIFILVDRQNKDDIVGYMIIKNTQDDYWQVLDVTVFTPYQNKGLGTDLYTIVVNSQYKLINGYSLSNQAEKVWIKLQQFVNVNVLNIITGDIEDFSDKPEKDNVQNTEQQWFYLATSKLKSPSHITENTFSDVSSNIEYARWLRADPTYKRHGFRSTKFGDDGEF